MPTLRNLDLNLLKVFDAVYTSGSVSGAARRLNMSQPSISRGLGRLRDHFEDPLFERSGNGVMPTAKAQAMLEAVRGALSLIGDTIEQEAGFDPATQTRQFRLLVPELVEIKVLTSLANALPPGSRVTFQTLPATEFDIAKLLVEDDVDVCITPFLPKASEIAYSTLYEETAVLVSRKNHPLLKDGFSLDLFDALRFIAVPDQAYRMTRLDELLKTKGLERKIACVTPRQSVISNVVAQTDLVAFMSTRYATFMADMVDIDVMKLPFLDASPQSLCLAYARSQENDPGIQWLCDQIEALYQNDAALA